MGEGVSFFQKLKPLLVVVALFVLPYFLLISYFAYSNNDVFYLRGGGPAWMLNPEDDRLVNEFPDDFPATYSTTFELTSRPVKAQLTLNAVRAYDLAVNGRRLAAESDTGKLNWKKPVAYDILPDLVPGLNQVTVHVRSRYSMTALKAEGFVETADGARVPLDSSPGWTVVSDFAFPPSGFNREPEPVKLLTHTTLAEDIRAGDYMREGLLVYPIALCVILVIILYPGLTRKLDSIASRLVPDSLKTEMATEVLYRASLAVIFLVLAVLLWHNFINYDPARTGDYEHHQKYLHHFLTSWRIPTADEGIQMYNPPLFYMAAALLFRLSGPSSLFPMVENCAQFVNSVSVLITMFAIFLILRRVLVGRLAVAASLAIAAFLPMSLYKAPSVAGDSATALVCTLSFYLWLRYTDGQKRSGIVLLAVSSGIGLLVRYTALFPFLGICAGLAYMFWQNPSGRKKLITHFAAYLAIVLLIAGGYYARNVMLFGGLFPINGTRELFFYRQTPGFRDWDFYTNVRDLILGNPMSKQLIMESFLAGTYSSFWFDGQHVFMIYSKVSKFTPYVVPALGLLPTALMAWGMARGTGRALSGGEGRGAFMAVCVVTAALGAAAFTLGSFKYPYYSIIKAFYLLFCLAPIVCFFGLGFEALTARSGRLAATMCIVLACAGFVKAFYL